MNEKITTQRINGIWEHMCIIPILFATMQLLTLCPLHMNKRNKELYKLL